jgi:flagellar hook-associated protein FlgK
MRGGSGRPKKRSIMDVIRMGENAMDSSAAAEINEALAAIKAIKSAVSTKSKTGSDLSDLSDKLEEKLKEVEEVAPAETKVAPAETKVAPAETKVAPAETKVETVESGATKKEGVCVAQYNVRNCENTRSLAPPHHDCVWDGTNCDINTTVSHAQEFIPTGAVKGGTDVGGSVVASHRRANYGNTLNQARGQAQARAASADASRRAAAQTELHQQASDFSDAEARTKELMAALAQPEE